MASDTELSTSLPKKKNTPTHTLAPPIQHEILFAKLYFSQGSYSVTTIKSYKIYFIKIIWILFLCSCSFCVNYKVNDYLVQIL